MGGHLFYRQSSDQIQSLNEQLGRKLRDRDSELAVVRAELGRERGRYDYASIVGASDEMKRVFSELDRIIAILERLESAVGERFRPSEALRATAQAGGLYARFGK